MSLLEHEMPHAFQTEIPKKYKNNNLITCAIKNMVNTFLYLQFMEWRYWKEKNNNGGENEDISASIHNS